MNDQSLADRSLVFQAHALERSILRDAGLPLPKSVCFNGPIADRVIGHVANFTKARL
jgi:hypothetical protein